MRTTPKKARRARSGSDHQQLEIVSSDGVLRFVLQRVNSAVRVTRWEKTTTGSRVTYSTLFHDVQAFERFCAADGLRFTYPLIYDQAKRAFDQLYPTTS